MSTAYPRSIRRCGFQRQLQPFHDPIGPPCANTTSGAGCSGEASGGRMSHDPTAVPSAACADTRSTRPRPAIPPSSILGASSIGFWCSPRAANRTMRDGWETVARSAKTVSPSGAGHRLEITPSATRHVTEPSARSTRKAAPWPSRSAVKKTALESGAQVTESGHRSRAGVRSRPVPVAMSTSQMVPAAATAGVPKVVRTAATNRPSGENAGWL